MSVCNSISLTPRACSLNASFAHSRRPLRLLWTHLSLQPTVHLSMRSLRPPRGLCGQQRSGPSRMWCPCWTGVCVCVCVCARGRRNVAPTHTLQTRANIQFCLSCRIDDIFSKLVGGCPRLTAGLRPLEQRDVQSRLAGNAEGRATVLAALRFSCVLIFHSSRNYAVMPYNSWEVRLVGLYVSLCFSSLFVCVCVCACVCEKDACTN